jgi:hypothetical protein
VIFVRNIGLKGQSVAREASGTQLDEIAFTSGTTGTFFVADQAVNVVYAISGTFDAGSVFAEAGQGAPVQGFIGALDTSSGILTPLLSERDGVLDPTTLTFIPAGF